VSRSPSPAASTTPPDPFVRSATPDPLAAAPLLSNTPGRMALPGPSLRTGDLTQEGPLSAAAGMQADLGPAPPPELANAVDLWPEPMAAAVGPRGELVSAQLGPIWGKQWLAPPPALPPVPPPAPASPFQTLPVNAPSLPDFPYGTFKWEPVPFAKGGFREVYRGYVVENGAPVAAKTPLKDPLKSHAPAIDELVREGRFMAAFRHTHVLACHGMTKMDLWATSADALVMDLAVGSLMDVLLLWAHAGAKPTPGMVGRALVHAAYGMAHMHAEGSIQGDTKPDNLMVLSDGRAVISDFGLAQVLEADGTAPVAGWGTLSFNAPEVQRKEKSTTGADVWSLGMTIYAVAYVSLPHAGVPEADLKARVRAGQVPELPDECNPLLREILEGCWKLDPAERITALQVAEKLNMLALEDVGRDFL
jgi:tRNA A-37 threonylcarbamoyl transferase component Bud32